MITEKIAEKAYKIRRHVIEAAFSTSCGHIGGSLSEAEILSALFFEVMDIDPLFPTRCERDRFVLSKGHASLGYYAALALRGFFPPEELHTFDSFNSRLQGHPDMHKTPGVDFSSGSLGQGLSVALGFALGRENRGLSFTSFALLGDGECQEGQVWEAIMYAGDKKVKGLVAIIDNNGVQLSGTTDSVLGIEPSLDHKIESFGWHVLRCDGHDPGALLHTLTLSKEISSTVPVAVIADTIKGKGVSFMEGEYHWHGAALSKDEAERALSELDHSFRGV